MMGGRKKGREKGRDWKRERGKERRKGRKKEWKRKGGKEKGKDGGRERGITNGIWVIEKTKYKWHFKGKSNTIKSILHLRMSNDDPFPTVMSTIWDQWWSSSLKELSITELYAVAQLKKPWVICKKGSIKITLIYEP